LFFLQNANFMMIALISGISVFLKKLVFQLKNQAVGICGCQLETENFKPILKPKK